MGRRCACDRLWARLEEDVRLRTLPMAAQLLWLKLMRLAVRTPDAVLRLGSELGFLTAVAVAVSAAETEVESNLVVLERRGLVVADRAAGTLTMPDAEVTVARASAARINGLKGGRPRKGESLEERRDRRQRELIMPLPGRAAETQGTEAETDPVKAHATTAAGTQSSSSSSGGAPPPAGAAEWVSLGAEVAELAGLDPARGGFDYRPVQQWLAEGATPEQIRAAVTRVAARESFRPQQVRSLGYFTQAVRDAMQQPTALAPVRHWVAEHVIRPADDERSTWSLHLEEWHAGGCIGPMPRRPQAQAAASAA
jgi:hypothetical protein